MMFVPVLNKLANLHEPRAGHCICATDAAIYMLGGGPATMLRMAVPQDVQPESQSKLAHLNLALRATLP